MKLVLRGPKKLIEGSFNYHESGSDHTFHLEGAGRVKITAYWLNNDGIYDYYRGTSIDAGDHDGEREWMNAWVRAGSRPLIRVDHNARMIAICA